MAQPSPDSLELYIADPRDAEPSRVPGVSRATYRQMLEWIRRTQSIPLGKRLAEIARDIAEDRQFRDLRLEPPRRGS